MHHHACLACDGSKWCEWVPVVSHAGTTIIYKCQVCQLLSRRCALRHAVLALLCRLCSQLWTFLGWTNTRTFLVLNTNSLAVSVDPREMRCTMLCSVLQTRLMVGLGPPLFSIRCASQSHLYRKCRQQGQVQGSIRVADPRVGDCCSTFISKRRVFVMPKLSSSLLADFSGSMSLERKQLTNCCCCSTPMTGALPCGFTHHKQTHRPQVALADLQVARHHDVIQAPLGWRSKVNLNTPLLTLQQRFSIKPHHATASRQCDLHIQPQKKKSQQW